MVVFIFTAFVVTLGLYLATSTIFKVLTNNESRNGKYDKNTPSTIPTKGLQSIDFKTAILSKYSKDKIIYFNTLSKNYKVEVDNFSTNSLHKPIVIREPLFFNYKRLSDKEIYSTIPMSDAFLEQEGYNYFIFQTFNKYLLAHYQKGLLKNIKSRSLNEFSKIDASKCAVYTFMSQDDLLFLACLESYHPQAIQTSVFILGLTAQESNSGSANGDELKVVYFDNFELNYNPFDKYSDQGSLKYSANFRPPFSAVSFGKGKYYLMTRNQTYVLETVNGLLQRTSEIFTPIYNPTTSGFQTIPTIEDDGMSSIPEITTSPNSRYIIYTFFNQESPEGGVIDTFTNKALSVNKACFTRIVKNEHPEAYNEYLDPFVGGPYKSITLLGWSSSNAVSYEQSYCSGGGCYQEGVINIVILNDNVNCES